MWPAIIAAGASLLGGAMANKQSEQNSAASMDWQERMRDTTYQSKVKDLQTAGLNPMLAFEGGGNPTPGAPNMPQVQNIGEKAATSALAAMQADRVNAETKLIEAQVAQTQAQTEMTNAQTGNTLQATANAQQQFYNIQEELSNIKAETNLKHKQSLTETERVNLMDAQRKLAQIQARLANGTIDLQDAQTAGQKIVNRLKELEVPGAENIADFEKNIGQISREAGAVGKAAQGLTGIANTARKVLGK